MTHPDYLREKARSLRISKKLTIDEIAERLALPRTTIYYWVRDLRIPRAPSAGWPESARRLGNLAMQAKYRRIRGGGV
jgi:transcriptional regulator with XRE-family HTH domain